MEYDIDARATKQIGSLNLAITQIVKDSITWLALGDESQERPPVNLGRRKLANLLNGSSNKAALSYKFHKCPYWGALAFLSVRKIESILLHMADLHILSWDKSPPNKVNVLTINETPPSNVSTADITNLFANRVRLPLDQVDMDLFERLRRLRVSISWGPGRNKYDRGWAMKICTDRILILICIHQPKDLEEFKVNIPFTEKLLLHAQSLIDVYMGDLSASSFSTTASALNQAVKNSQDVSILYNSMSSGWSTRTITPEGVYNQKDVEYCNGYCHTRKDFRMFRIDRISEFTVIE